MSDDRRQADEPADLSERAPNHVAYRACREGVTALLDAHPQVAGLFVPACPEWTVRDVVAHVVGNCMAAYGSLSRRPAPPRPADEPGLRELLDAWTETGPRVEELLAEKPDGSDILIMDTFTHELDIRRVLDLPPPAGHPAFAGALRVVVGGFSGSIRAHGLPALRIETEGAQWVAGSGEAVATLRAHPYDLYRSVAGRRTLEQISGLSWSAPAEPWLPAFSWGPFRPPAQAAEEPAGTGVAR